MTDIKNTVSILMEKSSDLYSESSFLDGLSSIFNLAGNNFDYRYSKTHQEADNRAIKKDWEIVGRDLFSSIKSYTK